MVCVYDNISPRKPGRLTGFMRRTGEGHVDDNSQKTMAALSEDASTWADAAGMLSAISTAIGVGVGERRHRRKNSLITNWFDQCEACGRAKII